MRDFEENTTARLELHGGKSQSEDVEVCANPMRVQ